MSEYEPYPVGQSWLSTLTLKQLNALGKNWDEDELRETYGGVSEFITSLSKGNRQRLYAVRVEVVAIGDYIDYHEYIQSDAWRERANAAKERAGWRCQVCNSNGQLDAHHRTYERLGNEEPGDITVLCRDCHALFHGKERPKDTAMELTTKVREYRNGQFNDAAFPEPPEEYKPELPQWDEFEDRILVTDHDEILFGRAKQVWPHVVERASIYDKNMYPILAMCKPESAGHDGTVYVVFNFPLLLEKFLDKPERVEVLHSALEAEIGQKIDLKLAHQYNIKVEGQ